MLFAKPEVSVSQNHAENSGPKFRLLIPDWIREKFDSDFWLPGRTLIFVLLFWPVWGLYLGLFGLKVNNGWSPDQAANW
jgi:hypothetical protein